MPAGHVLLCAETQVVRNGLAKLEGVGVLAKVPGGHAAQTRSAKPVVAVL